MNLLIGFLIFSLNITNPKINLPDTFIENSVKVMSINKLHSNQIGDSITIPEFEVSIELSKKAEEKLKLEKESIKLSAYFYGKPIDNIPKKYKKYLVPVGIFIRDYQVELINSRTYKYKGIKYHKKLYNLLADKDIEVNVNVFSGRRSDPYNCLNCNLLQDNISNIAGKTFKFNCKLIGE